MTELVTTEQPAFLKPVVSPKELINYHKEMVIFIQEGLEYGVDYGTVPGIDQPFLKKPGSERLCKAFNLAPHFDIIKTESDHNYKVDWIKRKKQWNNAYKGDKTFKWIEQSGTSLGLYSYTIKCSLHLPNGRVVAEGVGSCSTMEDKYVENPRNLENTVLKMAKKRAHVDATLTALGLSNRFTQDVEDIIDHAPAEEVKTTKPVSNIYVGSTEQQQKVLAQMNSYQDLKVPAELYNTIDEKLIELKAAVTPKILRKVVTEVLAAHSTN